MDVTVVAVDSGPVYVAYSPYVVPFGRIITYNPGIWLMADILGNANRLPRDAVEAIRSIARLFKHATRLALDIITMVADDVKSGFLVESGAPIIKSVEMIDGVLRVAVVCRYGNEAAPLYIDLPPVDAQFPVGIPFAKFVKMYVEAAESDDKGISSASVVAAMLKSLLSRSLRCYTGIVIPDIVNAMSFCKTVKALGGRLTVRNGCTLYRNVYGETNKMCTLRFTISGTVYTLFYTQLDDDNYRVLLLAGDCTIEDIASLCLALSM